MSRPLVTVCGSDQTAHAYGKILILIQIQVASTLRTPIQKENH